MALIKAPVSVTLPRQVDMKKGFCWQAAKFKVERGDGEFFEELDVIPNSGARSYKFEDSSYFPGTIHYRIVCVDADGNELCTYTDVIKITQRG